MHDFRRTEAAPDDVADSLRGYIPLTTVARLLGCHVATIYRWTSRDYHGVTLRYVQRGAKRATRREWLEEFFERLKAAKQNSRASPRVVGPTPALRTASQIIKGAADAGRVLDGVLGTSGNRGGRPKAAGRGGVTAGGSDRGGRP